MLAPGTILDHYCIESMLAKGAMGVVYLAVDTRLQRRVALKVLTPHLLTDPNSKRRFTQEARAASSLNHPNIITIHEIGAASGVDFIVMECVTGKTLEQLIRSGRLPPPRVVTYGIQIADALAKAHSARIVHRDLKPSNITVTNDDRVKVLDFGIAKLLDMADADQDVAATKMALTEEGVLIGTTSYMSPEQAEGRPVDSRSDVFSLGAILYELASGEKAFTGHSRVAVLTRILRDDPPAPSSLRSSVPADLDKVILRCLRKDAARRYQSMTDLTLALEDIGSNSAAPVEDRRVKAVTRLWPRFVMLALFVATGAVAWLVLRPTPSTEPLSARAVTTFPGQEQYPSLSPDGRHLAFSWNGPKQDNSDIYVQLIGSGAPLRLTTQPEQDFNTAWSPDGHWIAFLRAQPQSGTYDVRLIAPLGGPERKVTQIHTREIIGIPHLLSWCPNSKCLVFTDSQGQGKPDALFMYSLETGNKRQLTRPEPTALGDSQPLQSLLTGGG
jgi:eukaryotic-like serine/threonine-protein kinase